jgi:guanine deaminase
MTTPADPRERFMAEAIRLAAEGVARGDGGPFGAVVVKDGEILGRGWNRVVAAKDPTAHAEMMAIREAARRLGLWHLEGCELYTSCEPCPMCLSAAYWAHIERIYYAAGEADAAAIGFDDRAIREALARPPEQGRLPREQLLREEALRVFRAWAASPLRQAY